MRKFMETIKDTPEYQSLKKKTAGNRAESYAASRELLNQMENVFRNELQELENLKNNSKNSEEIRKKMEEKKEQIRQAMREPLKEAETMADIAGTIAGFGRGDSVSNPGKIEDIQRQVEIAGRIAKLPGFKKIMEMIGRMQRKAASNLKSRTDALQNIVGVEIGADIERILPEEFALIGTPMEVLFSIGFAEESLLQFAMEGNEPMGGGNIVACIDQSGSMWKERNDWAKTSLFGLYILAQKQKRKLHVILFDTSTRHYEVKGIETMMEIMENFLGGGTCFDRPLREACALVAEDKSHEKSDIIFITDGDGDIYPETVQIVTELKARKNFKLLTLHLGAGSNPVSALSNQTYTMKDFSEDSSVIDSLFSI
jgi:uncharacterized protein with von Willebrand factor type A (vWA) domain